MDNLRTFWKILYLFIVISWGCAECSTVPCTLVHPDVSPQPINSYDCTIIGYTFINDHPYEAFDNSLTRLTVKDSSLSHLPRPFLDKLKVLQHLSIHNTTLEYVDTIKLERLFSVNFTTNRIASIEKDTFINCPRLDAIDLSRNALELIPSRLLAGLRYLHHINLSYNKLKNLSREFFSDSPALEIIQLQSNSLEEFSMDLLWNLTNLQVLDVSNNYLYKFSSSEFFLNMYGESSILDLSNNLLTSLDLRNTRVSNVILNSNYLRQVSLGHGCRELFAKNNELVDISLNRSASTLQMLQMNHNKLRDNLQSICDCENLRSIFLAHNNITKIGFCFSKMRTLKEINLSGNKLTFLDYGYFFADFLETLDLSYNAFEEIEESVIMLFQSLRYLYLDGNHLSNFPNELDTILPHLVLIGLSHNRFECKKLLTLYRRLKATNRIAFNVDEPTPVNMTNIRGMICYKKNDSEIVEDATSNTLNHLNISNSVFWKELQTFKLSLEATNDFTKLPEKKSLVTQLYHTTEIPEEKITSNPSSEVQEVTDNFNQNTSGYYLPYRWDEVKNITNSTIFDSIFHSLRSIESKVKHLGLILSPSNSSVSPPYDRANVRTFATISVILAVLVLALGGGILWYNYHSYFFYKKLRENNAEAMRTFPTL